jgi:hypothetical protein
MSVREPQKIVEDIYNKIDELNDKPLDISEDLIESFGESMKEALRSWSEPQKNEGFCVSYGSIRTQRI